MKTLELAKLDLNELDISEMERHNGGFIIEAIIGAGIAVAGWFIDKAYDSQKAEYKAILKNKCF